MVGKYDSFLMSKRHSFKFKVKECASKEKINVLEGYAKVMYILHGDMFA